MRWGIRWRGGLGALGLGALVLVLEETVVLEEMVEVVRRRVLGGRIEVMRWMEVEYYGHRSVR
jgi:hypothetical protein